MGNSHGGKKKSLEKKFDKVEHSLLDGLFHDLAARSPGETIDKVTFLKLFRVPGMLGERLFAFFDQDGNEAIDYGEFMMGLSVYYRGTLQEKIRMLFEMYDLSGEGSVTKEELSTMLNSFMIPAPSGEETNSSSLRESDSDLPGRTPNHQKTTSTSFYPTTYTRVLPKNQNSDTNLRAQSLNTTSSNGGMPERSRSGSGGNVRSPLTKKSGVLDVGEVVRMAFMRCDLTKNNKLHFDEFEKFTRLYPEVIRSFERGLVFHTLGINDALNGISAGRETNRKRNSERKVYPDSPREPMMSPRKVQPVRIKKSGLSERDSSSSGKLSLALYGAKGGGTSPPPNQRDFEMTGLMTIKSDKLTTLANTKLICPTCGLTVRCCFDCGRNLEYSCRDGVHCGACAREGLQLARRSSESLPSKGLLPEDAGDNQSTVKISHRILLKFCMQCGDRMQESVYSTTTCEPTNRLATIDNREMVEADEIVIKGELFKLGSRLKKKSSRWVVVKGQFCYVFEKANDIRPKRVVFLEGCFIEPLVEENESKRSQFFGFELIISETNKKTYYCKTPEDRRDWIRALRLAAKAFRIQDFYHIGEKIGAGKFSVVHRAMHIKTREPFAVKVIDRRKLDMDMQQKEALRTEIAVLKFVNHPHIINMLDLFESRELIYIVMQFVHGGDLYDRIVARKRMDEHTSLVITWRLLSAIRYLHDRGIVHRDLKPENILCMDQKDDTNILIADFGLSKFAAPKEVMSLQCGTLAYVAPEVITKRGYGKGVDLWSIGVILFVMIRGGLPFEGRDQRDTVHRIMHKAPTFTHDCWKRVSKETVDLIVKLLQKNPDDRLSLEEATEHAAFNQLRSQEKAIEFPAPPHLGEQKQHMLQLNELSGAS